MARLSRTFLLLSLLAAAACGGSDAAIPRPRLHLPPDRATPSPAVSASDGPRSASASDAAILQFAVYVDGARRVLEGASCTPGAARSLECSAPLPSMTAGRHTLELAAFYAAGDTTVEGPKSTPLQLTIASVTAKRCLGHPQRRGPTAGERFSRCRPTAASWSRRCLGADLLDPVDVAVDGAGRTFVAERAGGIRILDPDRETTSGDRTDDLSSARDAERSCSPSLSRRTSPNRISSTC